VANSAGEKVCCDIQIRQVTRVSHSMENYCFGSGRKWCWWYNDCSTLPFYTFWVWLLGLTVCVCTDTFDLAADTRLYHTHAF